MENFFINITETQLSLDSCYKFIHHESCGGNTIFIGSVRNHSQGKEVIQLNFESFDKMALKEMKIIAEEALRKFEIEKIYIEHRKGDLKVADIAVIIGASARHRDAAFQACQFAIDTLKERVPIWKKEIYTDGVSWVNAHP